MPPPRTPLAGALADTLGEERLAGLRDELVSQIDALQLELRFVEAALARKPRRNQSLTAGTGKTARLITGAGHFAGIKRDEIFDLVRQHGQPVRPADVAALFAERGRETNTEAMRTALNRLVRDGRLVKPDPSTFAVRNGSIGSDGEGSPDQIPEIGSAAQAESR